MHRRRALELRLVDVTGEHRRSHAAKRATRVYASRKPPPSTLTRVPPRSGPSRWRSAARRQRSVVVEAAATREGAVEARQLHANPPARIAAARRRQAAQTRRAAAPARRRANRQNGNARHPATRRMTGRSQPSHRQPDRSTAERPRCEQTQDARERRRRVLARVVAHLDASLANRRPSRVAHDRRELAHTARRTVPPMRHVSTPSDSDADEKPAPCTVTWRAALR